MRFLSLIVSVILLNSIFLQFVAATLLQAEEKNECVDLTGTYLVTTSPENNVLEYQDKRIVGFPPGLQTIENSSFTIRQTGCEDIQIDYVTRFGYSRTDLISASKNGLRWNKANKMFDYSITAIEPDAEIVASSKYVRADAHLSLDKENFLICQFKIHKKHLWFGIPFLSQNSVYSDRFRFKRVSHAASSRH